jgi:hypothetical protein
MVLLRLHSDASKEDSRKAMSLSRRNRLFTLSSGIGKLLRPSLTQADK